MASFRLQRIASRIKFLVGTILQREISDPRVGLVTVLGVEVTPDMKEAKVRLSIFGKSGERSRTVRALEDSRGFIQREVGRGLKTRNTPRLRFLVDETQDKVSRIEALVVQAKENAEGDMAKKAGKKDEKSAKEEKTSRSAPKPSKPEKRASGEKGGDGAVKEDGAVKKGGGARGKKDEPEVKKRRRGSDDDDEGGKGGREFEVDDVGEEKDFPEEPEVDDEELEDEDEEEDEEEFEDEEEEEEEEAGGDDRYGTVSAPDSPGMRG
jgi:ribosome-binding factor A